MTLRKEKIKILITGVLICILLIIWPLSKKKRDIATKTTQGLSLSNTAISHPNIVKETLPAELTWGRDPFSKKSMLETEQGKRFLLTACIWDTENPIVVINDEVVSEGNEIDGYLVIKINKDSAVLKKGDEEITLELYE